LNGEGPIRPCATSADKLPIRMEHDRRTHRFLDLAAGRDRIVSPAEFRTLWDKAEGDREMRAFLALAGTTTMRTGEILSLRWDQLHLEVAPYATLVRAKTGRQRHVPIP
jgi:integrase